MSPQSFELEIDHETDNPLLHRKEVDFRVSFKGQGTPNRLEVRAKLAAMQGTDENTVYVRKIAPQFGTYEFNGMATIYEDETVAVKYEPRHIRVRNMTKDERKAAKKKKRKKIKRKKRK